MSRQKSYKTSQSSTVRAQQIKATIRKLKQKIQKLEREGEVGHPNCHIIRYQTKQNQKIYWYYKLQAAEPIFPMARVPNKKSKYLYLGKAGSEAHINAVETMTRRSLIDELERVINSLQESYFALCFGGETEPDPSYSNSQTHEVHLFYPLPIPLYPNTTKVYLMSPRNAILY